MNDEHSAIKLEAIELEQGISKRVVCVFCGGGTTHEKSMSLTRTDDAIVYHCFRDKCKRRGVVTSKGGFASSTVSKADIKSINNPYTGPTFVLSDNTKKFLCNKFYLDEDDLRGWRETDQQDVLMPLRDRYGSRYGYIDRRYIGLNGSERVPKSINRYENRDVPNLHFPQAVNNNVTTIVLVEDVVSAHRFSKYIPSAAMLGTNLDKRAAVHLRQIGIQNVLFFLDADANKTAEHNRKTHSLLFDQCAAAIRDTDGADPKDMNEEEILFWVEKIPVLLEGK